MPRACEVRPGEKRESPNGVAPASCGAIEPVSSEAFHRKLIEGMRCGILCVDRGGRLMMVNDPARQILELVGTPTVGVSVDEALEEYPQLAGVLRESFTMSSLPNRAEIDLVCGDGREKTIGFTLSMVPGEDGEPIGAAMFFKDLTHVEHREEQERLRDRLAALGQMAANLAHEIRNPLASIEVSCSLLKRRAGPGLEGRELLDKIIDEVRRLDRTITSSLEFVRPLCPNLAPCRIESVLDEALTVALGHRSAGAIAVECRYEKGIPPFLGDRAQLRQVFENLFINAVEAMDGEGVLRVTTSLAPAPASPSTPYRPRGAGVNPWQGIERYVVVRVEDTGPGIPDEHLDRLFYPFFTTKSQGSGLGLSMAKKILDSHRGLIDLSSDAGRGTTFTVRLPLLEDIREDSIR